MTKKIFSLILCGILVLSITGCEESKEENKNEEEDNPVIKINLNDNVEVYEELNSTLCGGWYFTTNAEEVFKEGIETNDNYKIIPVGGAIIAPHDWAEKFDQLTFDETKENKAKVEFDKIDGKNRYGIANYTSSFENHEFYYEYYTLEIVDSNKYNDFANALETSHNDFKNNFEKIFYNADAYLKTGPCGGASIKVILTEELCETYNLNCERW